jgi:hypothetical protein
MKNILKLFLVIVYVYTFSSCKKNDGLKSNVTIRGLSIEEIANNHHNSDSVNGVKILDLYLDSLNRCPVTVKTVSNTVFIINYIEYFKSRKDGLNKIIEYLKKDKNYRLLFDTSLDYEDKISNLWRISKNVKIPKQEVDSIFDQVKKHIQGARTIYELPGEFFVSKLTETLSKGSLYADSIQHKEIQRMGTAITEKYWQPLLKQVSNLQELEDLSEKVDVSYFFRTTFDSARDKKRLYIISCIKRNPQNYSFKELVSCMDYMSISVHESNYNLMATVVKKAKTYEECVELMGNYIPKDTPIWRACDRKAQKLLGLYP